MAENNDITSAAAALGRRGGAAKGGSKAAAARANLARANAAKRARRVIATVAPTNHRPPALAHDDLRQEETPDDFTL